MLSASQGRCLGLRLCESFAGCGRASSVRAALAALLVLFAALPVLGQSKIWNGSVDTNWHTPNNWTPAGVPGPADTVLIPAGGGSVSTSGNIVVTSVDVRRPMTISGSFTSAMTLESLLTLNGTLSGSLAAQDGAQINGASCSARLSNLAVSTQTVLTLTGTAIWSSVSSTGTIRLGDNARVPLDGNQVITGVLESAASAWGPAYITPLQGGTLTVAPGATIRGQGLLISATSASVCGGTGTLSLVNNGTIEGTDAGQPIYIFTETTGGSGVVRGPVRVDASLTNCAITLQQTAAGYPSLAAMDCNDRLDNVTFIGDLLNYRGSAIWNNVTATGKIQLGDNARVPLDGNQVITGVLESAASAWGPAYITPLQGGTLTVAPGATIRGQGLLISATSASVCGGTGTLSLVNNGTIEGTDAGQPIYITSPLLNLGSVLGFVNASGGTYGNDWTVATPTQAATVTSPRPNPGSGGTQTLVYREMYIAPGASFTLGSGETLNLNGGTGTLNIAPGAVFTSNGTVIGNIYNAGLLIIPITQVGTASQVTGPGTVILGGGGGAGSPIGWAGSPSGTLTVMAPPSPTVPSSPVVSGGVSWDGQLDVTGSYTQTVSGVMRLFIAGNARGNSYSLLNVGLNATLNGAVEIVLQPELQNFLPTLGSTFDMVYADGGLSVGPNGLQIRVLMTRAGSQLLGLSLPTYSSGFAADPNDLVVLPSSLFGYTLLPDGKSLRFTMLQPLCGAILGPADATTCPTGSVSVSAQPFFGVATGYAWEWAQPGSPDVWLAVTDGLVPGLGQISGATTGTVTIAQPQVSGVRLRCTVTGSCGSGVSRTATLTVLYQCNLADVSVIGTDPGTPCGEGQLTVDDVITFVNAFSDAIGCPGTPGAACNLADVTDIGDTGAGPDGELTVDDVIAFVNAFGDGC